MVFLKKKLQRYRKGFNYKTAKKEKRCRRPTRVNQQRKGVKVFWNKNATNKEKDKNKKSSSSLRNQITGRQRKGWKEELRIL